MVFNIDNVYFKWDDSLKGKNVLVADSLYSLKKKVEGDCKGHKNVTWSDELLYFVDEDGSRWHYAYPVTKFYVVLNGTQVEFAYTAEPKDCHVFAEFDSEDDATNWCYEHDKFAEVAKAWLDGKQIQFRRDNTKDWMPTSTPCWGLEYEYRVKPANTAEDFKIGKIYRNEVTGRTAMCVAKDVGASMPVCLGSIWETEDDLVNWHEVVEENA